MGKWLTFEGRTLYNSSENLLLEVCLVFFHQIDNSRGDHYYESVIFQNKSFLLHFHKNYELIYIIQGDVEAVIGDKTFPMSAGDFALCLPNEVHTFLSKGPTQFWLCIFSPDYVPEFDKAVQGKTGTTSLFRCEDGILDYFKKYMLHYTLEGTGDHYRVVAGLNLACGEYLRNVQLIERNDKEYVLMNDIADYISKNFRSKLTLKDVAIALGYDYYYFSRVFHKIFRTTFNDYLNTCRFNVATKLLRTTNNSVYSIATESGFQSLRAFNDTFLKKAGMSPTQYRNKLNPPT